MKILFRTVGTLSGVAYQMKDQENSTEFFDNLEKIQEENSDYFDQKEMNKYESLFDSDNSIDNNYIIIDNKDDEYFTFHWEESERDSNYIESLYLRVPKVFLERLFDTEIEVVILPTL